MIANLKPRISLIIKNNTQNIFIFFLTLLICFLNLEIATRYVFNVPIWAFQDWRDFRFQKSGQSGANDYDPITGWVNKAGLSSSSMNTIQFGIRKNRPSQTELPQKRGILVVGDSFSAGSQVNDDQTWPSYLENIMGVPVNNAAVGGWGIDQMVLREELLADELLPNIVIIGTQEEGILRVGYSAYGAPKPYFTEGENLEIHNQPVPMSQNGGQSNQFINILSHSFVIAQVLGFIDNNYWYSNTNQNFVKTNVDETKVSCQLLKRLKSHNERLHIRTVLVLQYSGSATNASGMPQSLFSLDVAQCARNLGIETVDTFSKLRNLARENEAEFNKLFVIPPPEYGHMSAVGNQLVANMVAEVLHNPKLLELSDNIYNNTSKISAKNLIIGSEKIECTSAVASITKYSDQLDQIFRINATGCPGEHYAVLPLPNLIYGSYTLSFKVRSVGTSKFRVQLTDAKSNGIFYDVDLLQNSGAIYSRGTGLNQSADLTIANDGWAYIRISTSVPEAGLQAVIKLLNARGEAGFVAANETIEIKQVQLEQGLVATNYISTK